MARFVPFGHLANAELARKIGRELTGIYVNPESVTMVAPSDKAPHDQSVIHFVSGQSVEVAENFGPVAAKLSYPRGADAQLFRAIWFLIQETIPEKGKRANFLTGMLKAFMECDMNPEDLAECHEEVDSAVKRVLMP